MPFTSTPLQPGFMLLQGNKLEDLRDLLSEWITSHPLQPLENECILVQSNGIAQWLKMALARDKGGCGIAAAVDVTLPGRFLWQAYRSVFANLPKISPYDKAPLTWRLYALLGNWQQLEAKLIQLGEDPNHLEPLQSFLQVDSCPKTRTFSPRRLHQLAANLADLYDQYQVYRADWLAAWQQKKNQLITARGEEKPLEAKDLWQPVMWRLLIAEINADPQLPSSASNPWAKASRASIHQAVIEECKKFSLTHRPANLPRRVLVFGISSLPRQTLDLLHALAPFTQVLVFASNPSKHYWGDLVEGKDLLRQEYKRVKDRKINPNLNPEDLHLAGNPLLASWGKQGRDYLHLLDEQDAPESYKGLFNSLDIFSSPLENSLANTTNKQPSLLNQLQDDIFELRSISERLAAVEKQELTNTINPATDTSLQFITAHSAQREIEILHDQLLKTFSDAQAEQQANGEPLAPRDILVMVPNIDDYAPAIQAVFGRYSLLPFHITDQNQRKQNTLLIALEKLLSLPTSRFTVSELLSLLDTPALRAKYQLEEADLPKLKDWILGANIRWGLSGAQKAKLDLPNNEQNTWLFGLRRLLLGFASGSAAWQNLEPHDEVAGLEAALLGPLAQLLDDLQLTLQQLEEEQSPHQWLTCIEDLLTRFFVETSKADGWALMNLEIQLEQLADTWHYAGMADVKNIEEAQLDKEPQLSIEVIAEELLANLDQPNLTQKFLGGAINFATLMPMRAIPFKQVWLLGMNDGDYPRKVHAADFDLMANDYRPGDRSRREDDRYLFLEALLAARQKLVISWVGRSQRDNTPRPPSVLVSQLRDYLAAGWQLADSKAEETAAQKGEQLLDALTTEHPLQAFSQDYFLPNRPAGLFTYAKEWRQVHSQQEEETPSFTPWQPEQDLSLNDLASFLRYPIKNFYSLRLGVSWYQDLNQPEDEETFNLTGLSSWALNKQLIDATLQQFSLQQKTNQPTDIEQLIAANLTRIENSGSLAMPPFASQQKQALLAAVSQPLISYQEYLAAYPQTLASFTAGVTHPSQPNLALIDSLSDLRTNTSGDLLRLVLLPSRLHQGDSYKWYHLVRLWPSHLFAQLNPLNQPVITKVLGPDTEINLPPFSSDPLANKQQAEAILQNLLASWLVAANQPLPLPCKTACVFLTGNKPQEVYEGGYFLSGEIDDHPAFSRFWPSYQQLSEEALFSQMSEQLYQPLIDLLTTPQATTPNTPAQEAAHD